MEHTKSLIELVTATLTCMTACLAFFGWFQHQRGTKNIFLNPSLCEEVIQQALGLAIDSDTPGIAAAKLEQLLLVLEANVNLVRIAIEYLRMPKDIPFKVFASVHQRGDDMTVKASDPPDMLGAARKD